MNENEFASELDAPIVLSARNVSHFYGALEALHEVSFSVRTGEFVAVVGPSGCGKSTLLSLLGGFENPTQGAIVRHGETRTVFQEGGLFPWLCARDNVALALRHLPERERETEAQTWLQRVGLGEFGAQFPHRLSGGMKRRVEIARALAGNAPILLLDEPFSALDYLMRLSLRDELAHLLEERPRGVVLVTHDVEEAAQLADRVLILSGRPGRVQRELVIELPRPRDALHPEVVAATRAILDELGVKTKRGQL